MVPKQLIVAVEGTAAVGPFWKTIVSDYLKKIIRYFCVNEPTDQKSSTANVELSLVMFNAHGSYSACLVQRSGWTRDMDTFFQWLSAIPFVGGGFNDAAIAEGLAEALMMFSFSNGNQNQNVEGQRHCILVAGSNPYPLPTAVYKPQYQNPERANSAEIQPDNHLSDAETLAKVFAQYAISLSIICPKQLPKLRGIYNAGKRNPRAADPPVDNAKNPYFLILISENFMEACSCLSRSEMTQFPSNQNPVKADATHVPSLSGPPSVPSASGSVLARPTSVGSIPLATVKVEPITVTSAIGPSYAHISTTPSLKASSPISMSQDMTIIPKNEKVVDMKPLANNATLSLQPISPAANVRILNDVVQARQVLSGGTSIGVSSMGTPVISNMISSGMPSSIPLAQAVSSGPGPTPVSTVATPALYISAAPNVFGTSTPSMSQPSRNIQNVSVPQTLQAMSQGTLSSTQMMHMGMSLAAGMSQRGPQGMQPVGVNYGSSVTITSSNQQAPNAFQAAQSKYIKMWEGNLSGQRESGPVFIAKLEGYRSATASESLAANWPEELHIVRLISQDHMNNKQYEAKADFLVFRAMTKHGFLVVLQEKKLCAVIQLPSQTLLLSGSDKSHCLIGMLFPGNMVAFKPQIPNQLQQQQMVSAGMNQAFVPLPAGRSTQRPPQGPATTMSGGGFMG